MLCLLRIELVAGIELLVLDAATHILLVEGEDVLLLQKIAHALRARVAIADRISYAMVVCIEQDIVHCPGIDADGIGNKTTLPCHTQALDDVLEELVHVPAEVPILLDEAILEAIDLLEDHAAVDDFAHDVAPARGADVDSKMPLSHCLPNLEIVNCSSLLVYWAYYMVILRISMLQSDHVFRKAILFGRAICMPDERWVSHAYLYA